MTSPGMDWDRIGRYLAGEASREEAAEVRRWLDEHRSDAELVSAVERLTRAIRGGRPVDVEAALRSVKTRQTPRQRIAVASPGRLRRWMTQTEVMAAAAAIILVAGVALFDQARDLVRGGAQLSHSTSVGQRDSVRLEDGSLIVLGPASRVAVRGREVDLTGEAFFRVVHDDKRPFIVRTGGSVIRDIGTEFVVHTDDATAATRVVVQEGSVALSRGSDSVMLQQGDVGRVAEGRVEALPGRATADDFAWMRGELIFRDTPISTVIADLRRWYGVEVRVADLALLQRRFTGTFTTEPRERVLDVIAMALPARVERRGDTAYFRPATSSR